MDARLIPKGTCRLPPSPAENDTMETGSSIGGKPLTKRRAEPLVSVSEGRHEKAPPKRGKVTIEGACRLRALRVSRLADGWPVPAAGERLHGGFQRRLEAMHPLMAGTEGEVNRPDPRLPMVSESVEQRNPADDVCVLDHFVLRGISVGCSSRSVMRPPTLRRTPAR